jgi:hypothetical protein
LLQFRNVPDLGGLYFSFNLILSQASVAVCALLYHTYYDEDNAAKQPEVESADNATITNSAGTKLTEEQLLVSVGSLFAVFLFSFTLFIAKIERKYVKTFFSTETAHAKVKRRFLNGDDYQKSLTFTCQKRQWASIRPQVKKWLDENWDRWERDNPDWFNSVFIASVDKDIMPKRALAAEK